MNWDCQQTNQVVTNALKVSKEAVQILSLVQYQQGLEKLVTLKQAVEQALEQCPKPAIVEVNVSTFGVTRKKSKSFIGKQTIGKFIETFISKEQLRPSSIDLWLNGAYINYATLYKKTKLKLGDQAIVLISE